jgi:hypothetical protein
LATLAVGWRGWGPYAHLRQPPRGGEAEKKELLAATDVEGAGKAGGAVVVAQALACAAQVAVAEGAHGAVQIVAAVDVGGVVTQADLVADRARRAFKVGRAGRIEVAIAAAAAVIIRRAVHVLGAGADRAADRIRLATEAGRAVAVYLTANKLVAITIAGTKRVAGAVQVTKAAGNDFAERSRATEGPYRAVEIVEALDLLDAGTVDLTEKPNRAVEVTEATVLKTTPAVLRAVLVPIAVGVVITGPQRVTRRPFTKEAAAGEEQ